MRVLLTLSFLLIIPPCVYSQRFLRSGFSNQEDFAAEMRLDNSEMSAELSREMHLAKDMSWQIPAFAFDDTTVRDRALRGHLQKYLGKHPVNLKLINRRGKHGMQAVGMLPSGKKLRVFWREGDRTPKIDLLKVSYDEAVRARLPSLHLEVQLPPIKKRGPRVLPSVVYQVPLHNGSLNLKTVVPRAAAKVQVWPEGRRIGECLDVGECFVAAAPIRNGVIDPSWAKGRQIFRRGRKSGLV